MGVKGAWISIPLKRWNFSIKRLSMHHEFQLYGQRILRGGDMESGHQEFMKWTAGYDEGISEGTNTLLCHLGFLKKLGVRF